MAQAPVMPVFTDALIGDTTHLSTEQFGAYFLILLATWRNNGVALPDDDEQLAHVCRTNARRWRKKLRPILQKFFDINGTGWHQQRLEKEWNRVQQKLAKRRASGSAGAKARASSKRGSIGLATHKGELRSPKESESVSNTESLNAAREEGQEKKRRIRLSGHSPPLKTPALKAKIKAQLAWKHCRFLAARGRPGESEAYFAAIDSTSMVPPQQLFDTVDRRMRTAGWDDMRQWKYQRGIPA